MYKLPYLAFSRLDLITQQKYPQVQTAIQMQGGKALNVLTHRQSQVMSLKSLGRTNKEIAAELGVNESTIHEHIQSAVKKFGATNPTHCVTLFARQELTDRLRHSGLEETLRAYIAEQTGQESLSDVTLDDGLVEIIEYIDTVLSRIERDD